VARRLQEAQGVLDALVARVRSGLSEQAAVLEAENAEMRRRLQVAQAELQGGCGREIRVGRCLIFVWIRSSCAPLLRAWRAMGAL
jgi:hypothetical protein